MIIKGENPGFGVRVQEWDYIYRSLIRRVCPKNTFESKATLAGVLEAFQTEVSADSKSSGPLFFAVSLALDYVRSSSFKMNQLQSFLKGGDADSD